MYKKSIIRANLMITLGLLLVFKAPLSVVGSNFINLIILLLVIIVIFLSVNNRLGGAVNKEVSFLTFCLFLIILLTTLSGIIIFNKLFFISFTQVFFPILLIFVFKLLSFEEIKKIYSFFLSLFMFLSVYAVIEVALIPESIRKDISYYVLLFKTGGEPLLASMNDGLFSFEWSRTGSLIFDPLPFGVMLSVYISSLLNSFKIKYFLLLIGLLLAGVKSGFLILMFSLYANVIKKYTLVILFFILIIFLFLTYDVLSTIIAGGNRIPGLHSISNHLLGLYWGFINTLDSFFLGNGLGTSGYLVWLEANKLGINTVFLNDGIANIGLMNGNESAVGVLIYQLGFIFVGVILFFYIKVLYYFFENKIYNIVGLMLGYLGFFFVSESGLSLSLHFIVMLVLFYNYSEVRMWKLIVKKN